jgi:glutamyl-tRNA(Gln) amidotransferase subunit D
MREFHVGDNATITGKQFKYTGTVMPSSDNNILVLKLDNGYNVGIMKDQIDRTTLVHPTKVTRAPIAKIKSKIGLPNVTIISTGGTITSKVDYKTGAVHPLTKPEELINNIPELSKLANLKMLAPFSKLSEDMMPEDWQKIAEIAAIEMNKGAEGVVVTHGTDTLHFTAAALSFMIKDLSKPIAVVGGQRSSDRGSFDGAQNLICAVRYCLSNIAEVSVVMHANSDDDYCYAMRGTKVRKLHSSRRDAFRPINCLPLATIDPKKGVNVISKDFNKRTNKKVKLDNRCEPKVALIKYSPGLDPNILDYYISKDYKGVVIEGTGFGHVATTNWIEQVNRASEHMIVCMTTQTIYGTTNNHIYSAGVNLYKAGVVYCKDTLPETAYVKLMILLGQNKNIEGVRRMMAQNLVGEINERIEKKSFLF